MKNFLAIDVEDYYQVSGMADVSLFEKWESQESRTERNLEVILCAMGDVKGTFFVLGWEAEKRPQLVKMICRQGHETATHGYSHRSINDMTRANFKAELERSVKLLEDLSGHKILGHRAPSFSITCDNLWAFEVMTELGLRYDSSVVPIKRRRGGIKGAERTPYIVHTESGELQEFPMAVTEIAGRKIPVAGGGFFRLFPYWFTRNAILRLNSLCIPVVVYLHPWEFDPGQPRLKSFYSRNGFNHYVNLSGVLAKFKRLLNDFEFISFSEYLQSKNQI
ncbi:DUF3473 domain-containing protein [bacterium]|nr:DUF3473 domain-containing protein [bacterium]